MNELDSLDRVAAAAFPGYLVRKDLVRRYARQFPAPTPVVEFLPGRYCASTDDAEIEPERTSPATPATMASAATTSTTLPHSSAPTEGDLKPVPEPSAPFTARITGPTLGGHCGHASTARLTLCGGPLAPRCREARGVLRTSPVRSLPSPLCGRAPAR